MKNNRNGVENILRKSVRATCGITEREVTVPSIKVPQTISKLQKAGFSIVGTSHGKTPTKKVWFVGALRF